MNDSMIGARPLNRMVNGIFIVAFTVILLSLSFGAFMAFQAITTVSAQDWSGGIKPVVERAWCGKVGCFSDK